MIPHSKQTENNPSRIAPPTLARPLETSLGQREWDGTRDMWRQPNSTIPSSARDVASYLFSDVPALKLLQEKNLSCRIVALGLINLGTSLTFALWTRSL